MIIINISLQLWYNFAKKTCIIYGHEFFSDLSWGDAIHQLLDCSGTRQTTQGFSWFFTCLQAGPTLKQETLNSPWTTNEFGCPIELANLTESSPWVKCGYVKTLSNVKCSSLRYMGQWLGRAWRHHDISRVFLGTHEPDIRAKWVQLNVVSILRAWTLWFLKTRNGDANILTDASSRAGQCDECSRQCANEAKVRYDPYTMGVLSKWKSCMPIAHDHCWQK